MTEKVNVMEEDWDYLIILDACRYDYFRKVYKDYLRGELKKAISLASDTLEWCKKTFQKRYEDVIYISANPFINSKVEIKGFNAKNYFYKVIDVWKWGWNEQLGTVHPREVNQAMQSLKDDHVDKRFMIHYLQPHAPYIEYTPYNIGFSRPKIETGHILSDIQDSRPLSRIEKGLLKLLVALASWTRVFGETPSSWKIRELLSLPPASPMDAVRRSIGDIGLRRAYVGNLRLVLKYVARLVEDLCGVTIITADHGECLGERGRYSHRAGLSDPFLIEIPWFKIAEMKRKAHHENAKKKRGGRKRERSPYTSEEKERIKERLKLLGYLD